MKLDVQGAEFVALQGLRRVLSENVDMHIFVEFWPEALRRADADPNAFLDYIASFGFGASLISEGEQSAKPLVWSDLRAMASDSREYNLLLTRAD